MNVFFLRVKDVVRYAEAFQFLSESNLRSVTNIAWHLAVDTFLEGKHATMNKRGIVMARCTADSV